MRLLRVFLSNISPEQDISPTICAALQRVSKVYRDLMRGTSDIPEINNFVKQSQSSYIDFLSNLGVSVYICFVLLISFSAGARRQD